MANKKFWLGILVMVLVFGMTVVGCDNDTQKDVLDGTTWRGKLVTESGTTNYVLTFTSPNFTNSMSFMTEVLSTSSGTYTISGNSVTLTYAGSDYTTTGTLSGNKSGIPGKAGGLNGEPLKAVLFRNRLKAVIAVTYP
jgi:hypothetical protein